MLCLRTIFSLGPPDSDRPFLFPECGDIGYYRDNIKLESTRDAFLFPECDDTGYYLNDIMYDSIRAKYQII